MGFSFMWAQHKGSSRSGQGPGPLQTRASLLTLCRDYLASPCVTLVMQLVRAEARPHPGIRLLGGTQGDEAWSSVSRVQGTRGLVSTLSPCLGAGPTPGLR